jgi:hypothetical protein
MQFVRSLGASGSMTKKKNKVLPLTIRSGVGRVAVGS